uniref:Uncharacterized protein n=1 Tax=Quercus lobata TaxID=97700 RepID=A0A7N2RDS0_QUELO
MVLIICFVFILTIIPLSGAILNPLVTFIAALKGAVTLVRACVYFLGQCTGSIMGYLLIKCVMSHDAVVKYMLVAFDKKRCKELGVTMVCVLLSASLSIAVCVHGGHWGARLCWCRPEPYKVLRPSIDSRRSIVVGTLGILVGAISSFALFFMVTLKPYLRRAWSMSMEGMIS